VWREDIHILYLLLILGSMLPSAFTIVVKGLLCSPMLVAAANNPFGNMGSIVHGLVLHSSLRQFLYQEEFSLYIRRPLIPIQENILAMNNPGKIPFCTFLYPHLEGQG